MQGPDFKTGCIVCSKELVYSDNLENLTCYLCRRNFRASGACCEGHLVCDTCHRSNAVDPMEKYLLLSFEKNPVRLALALMKSPNAKLHGSEHRYRIAIVLLTMYNNTVGKSLLKDNINVELPAPEKYRFIFSDLNKECLKEDFPSDQKTLIAAL